VRHRESQGPIVQFGNAHDSNPISLLAPLLGRGVNSQHQSHQPESQYLPQYHSNGTLASSASPRPEGADLNHSHAAHQALSAGASMATQGGSNAGLMEGFQGGLQGSQGNHSTNAAAGTTADISSTRVDLQLAMRCLEQVLPCLLLLLLVFLKLHWMGILVFTWVTLILVRANDVIRKQVALKGARRAPILVGTALTLIVHIVSCYACLGDQAMWRQVLLLPPLEVPSFWQALWTVAMTDTMVRFAVVSVKACLLLASAQLPGQAYRRQCHKLTLVEHAALLYRVLLPVPVWYRFFLDKATYGHFFSSLTTGLYLTFKCTAVLERGWLVVMAIRALALREAQYGQTATPEQVMEAGNSCAICHEQMKSPIRLHCNHLFCEECVLEWFERERTCPLCRAVVRSAGLRSYGDGSTGLLLQVF